MEAFCRRATGSVTRLITGTGKGRAKTAVMSSEPPAPMTLGNAAAASVRLLVRCKDCGYWSEPDPAEQACWYGPETMIREWHQRLVCSRCGGREVDFVLTGARR